MARVVETEQVKRKKRKRKICIIAFCIVVLLIFGLLSYKFVFSKWGTKNKVEVKILDTVENYDYVLSDQDSKLYKQEFTKLKDLLKKQDINEEEYAKQTSKLFVIDLFTLNTKINKYDVGGTEFYHRSKKTMFETKVMDTLYNTMQDNTYGNRKQELPEVSSIEEVSCEKGSYKMNDTEVEAYFVQFKWSYVKDLQYDKEGSLVVIKDDFWMSVVDFQPTLSPKYK